jgi:hypothetical protein
MCIAILGLFHAYRRTDGAILIGAPQGREHSYNYDYITFTLPKFDWQCKIRALIEELLSFTSHMASSTSTSCCSMRSDVGLGSALAYLNCRNAAKYTLVRHSVITKPLMILYSCTCIPIVTLIQNMNANSQLAKADFATVLKFEQAALSYYFDRKTE